MNRTARLLVLFMLFVAACKNKEKETGDASGYFPVVSYLQSQVRHVDTSLYSITQVRNGQGIRDTAYLRREDFRAAAQDFLSLPDLASKDLRKKYTETKMYDEDLKKVVLTYMPKDKTDYEQILREDVLIEPGDEKGDQVQTIYIETVVSNNDSTVQKKMTWNVNKNFQVIKLINKKDLPETVTTMDVTWSDGR